MNTSSDIRWNIAKDQAGQLLDAIVRTHVGISWNKARSMIQTGKVFVDGQACTSPTRRLHEGQWIEIHPQAPRPKTKQLQSLQHELLVYVDAHLVVVNKPAGISTVPFGDAPFNEATLDALVRELLAKQQTIRGRAPLGVVHRLDKPTTGLIVFARTVAAKKHLAQQLRVHSMYREYIAIAHGSVREQKIETYISQNRGDGIRGTSLHGKREGQHAVTYIKPIEKFSSATLIACRLETGRTHQIRIHLSEYGHPLLGENVYIRNYNLPLLPAPRLMLHARTLTFKHPVNEQEMTFSAPIPTDFERVLQQLRQPSP